MRKSFPLKSIFIFDNQENMLLNYSLGTASYDGREGITVNNKREVALTGYTDIQGSNYDVWLISYIREII